MTHINNHDQTRLSGLSRFFQGGWTSPILISLSISLVLFSIQLFFFQPFFLTNDDIFKILAVKGIGTTSSPSPYIGYSNVLLGYGLVKLFSWIPSFPWYSWFLCLVQLFSFWAFLWLLCLKSPRRVGVLFFIGAWISVYFIFFTFLQFTMTAGLAAGVGILLFCLAPESFDGPRRVALLAVSAILLILGYLLRDHFFYLMFLVALPVLIFRARDSRFRSFARRNWPWPAGALLVCLAFGSCNHAWLQKDPAWREYGRIDRQRVELQDYWITEYNEKTKPYFDSVGWTENDFWLFKNWFWLNAEKYNAQNIQKLRKNFPRIGSTGKYGSFLSLGELFRSFWDQRIMLFFLVFCLFCSRTTWRFLFMQFLWAVLVFLFLIYFFRAPDRLTLPILVFVMNLPLFYAEAPGDETGIKEPWTRRLFRGRVILLAAVFAVCLPTLRQYYFQNRVLKNSEKGLQECLAQMNPRDNQLFVIWDFPFESIGAFNDFECFSHFNMFVSVFSQTCPANMETLRRFGIRDPFRDAVDNPDVFLICTREQGRRYHDYLKENYGLEIVARRAFACAFFRSYTIHSVALEKKQKLKTNN